MMPVAITARTVVRLVWSSITSPIALLYRFCHYIDYQSSILIRDLVMKPDYSDPWSIKGAIEDELDTDTIPGLGGSNLMGIEPEVDSTSSATWPLTMFHGARDSLMGALWAGKRWFRWGRL
jgi:hypothetical protein